ncbi:rhomboid family intramembrane serine protease [Aquirufa sp. ROCK2-A2]
MKSIWQDIKLIFQQSDNGLMKIIIVNIAIFIVLNVAKVGLLLADQGGIFNEILQNITLSSQPKLALFKPWTFISYFFVHIELFHLIFNMMFLYWFGQILSDYIGEKKITQVFFLGGLAGAIFYLLLLNSFSYFISRGPTFLNGASAGVYAVVIAAATLRPNYGVFLFIIGEVKIKYIAFFYVIWSFIETIGSNAGGNIAHLGGAAIGLIYALNFQRPKKIVNKKESVVFSYVQNAQKKTAELLDLPDNRDIQEDELNQILDKISKSGYDSLSKYEKRRLFKASQKND